MRPGLKRILVYLGLAVPLFIGAYYLVAGLSSLLGIVIPEMPHHSAGEGAEYLLAGVFLLALVGLMIVLYEKGFWKKWYHPEDWKDMWWI